ncbi:hypothetical protein OQ279_05960 [Salinimicrobium sp. MT39]|uniref:Uncharacterized protein n=1 Tax=Salinimicrobium profundisediminis TaxID=2994553 RepID=A0A9X3CWB6_9FLAO|nr:hypothetical protein [Salinimicrobium profundisediminis]MCX2837693.1 hypothetical protein [Salinimicrobium profundisediminis]
MKSIFFIFLRMIFWSNSSAQNQESDKYDSFTENENYQVQMKISDNKHIIKYSRKIDSLNFHLEIIPSMRNIFDSVSRLSDNKQIFIKIIQVDKNLYQIDQMNFINLDGRNISVHRDSDHLFNIDLSDYKLRMIDCQNCMEEISFSIYDKETEKE